MAPLSGSDDVVDPELVANQMYSAYVEDDEDDFIDHGAGEYEEYDHILNEGHDSVPVPNNDNENLSTRGHGGDFNAADGGLSLFVSDSDSDQSSVHEQDEDEDNDDDDAAISTDDEAPPPKKRKVSSKYMSLLLRRQRH